MREGIETAGGRMEVIPYENHLIVRGMLSMVTKGVEEA